MNSMVVGGAHPARREHLLPVPDAQEADVRDIFSAPSARRRVRATRAEDPAMHRRPVKPRSESRNVSPSFSLRSFLVWVGAAALLSVVGGGLGVLVQPDSYSGPTRIHSVTAGESVWSLAQTVTTDRPLENVVVDIESLNDIKGGLTVGQNVVLPMQ